MKKILLLMMIIFSVFLPSKLNAEEETVIIIHYFQNEYCMNCQETAVFFDENFSDDLKVKFVIYDTLNQEDLKLTKEVLAFFNKPYETPSIVVGTTIIQGSEPIKNYLNQVIEYYQNKSEYKDLVDMLIKNDTTVSKSDVIKLDEILTDEELTIQLPWVGKINLKSFSLFLAAVIIGLVDGFNPCAMWVLVFLITLLINLKSRKKIWILGLTFIATSGLLYFLIMMTWFQIIDLVIYIRLFQISIGVLSMIFALLSFKNYWNQRLNDIGCEVTDKESQSKLMQKIRKVIENNNLWLAILGIIGVAVTVNFIELACSAGLPAIYTSMLAYHGLTTLQSIFYILIYVFFFILDDLLIFIIAVVTFKITGISNKYTRYSHLIGAIIMLLLGLSLVFFPNILF